MEKQIAASADDCLQWAEDALRYALQWETENAPQGQLTISPQTTIDAMEAALGYICSVRKDNYLGPRLNESSAFELKLPALTLSELRIIADFFS